jgi:large subunit ribosomal protein L24
MQATKPVKKPAKQRRMLHNAPDHVRHKLLGAPLSPELRKSRRVRTLPVRKGDTVRVVRGDHKGFEGKISRIDKKRYRIYVEGLTRDKVDGTAIFIPVHPSKIIIKNLNLDDKWRKKILERKKEAPEKVERVVKKPAKKIAEVKEVVEEKVAVEEKPPKKKPKARTRRVAKKPAAEEKKEKAEKIEEKPKAKKTRAKRKTTKKNEGGT